MGIRVTDIALPKDTILVNQYRIDEVCYLGEQDIVYFAENIINQGKVVIKEFMPFRVANRDLDGINVICKGNSVRNQFEQSFEAFELECQNVKKLKGVDLPYKNCLVNYVDCLHSNNTLYLVTDRIMGCNLSECLDELDTNEKWIIIKDLLDIVSQIHNKGIVHCDIKPSNIIVRNDGRPALIDFGNSCVIGQTKNNVQFASRSYSAPELYSRDEVDEKSDIYSLGATIYQLLTGYQIPQAYDYDEEEALPAISEFTDIDPEWEQRIMNAMSRDKKKRPESLLLL